MRLGLMMLEHGRWPNLRQMAIHTWGDALPDRVEIRVKQSTDARLGPGESLQKWNDIWVFTGTSGYPSPDKDR